MENIKPEELIFHKYYCKDCGKEVAAHSVDDIIEKGKLCADCIVIDVTGGLQERPKKHIEKNKYIKCNKNLPEITSLKREKKKKTDKNKKPISYQEREAHRAAEDAKWERIREGYRTVEFRHNHSGLDDQQYIME